MTQDNRLLTDELVQEYCDKLVSQTKSPMILNDELKAILEDFQAKTRKAVLESPMLLDWLKSAIEAHDASTRMITRNKLEEAHDKGFKEGVEKTTDACNSTFGSMLEEAKKQTAEEIKRELEGKYQLPGNGIYRTLIYGGDVYVNSESWQKFWQRRVGE